MGADDKTMEYAISKATWDLLYLVRCALKEEPPDKERLSQMEMGKIHQLAGYHSLTSVTCMTLEGTDAFASADPALVKRWKAEKDQAIRKVMLLNAERVQILKELEQAGIWYLPLKGEYIQKLYPRFGMRQSADVDILYDSSRQKDVTAIMTARGYVADEVGLCHHDVYQKPPVYNIEMHTALFEKTAGKRYRYYQDIKKRLLPMAGTEYGFRFREEDFYIYVTAHAFGHYKAGGIGLRILADNYAYRRAKAKDLDWPYIQKTLDRLEMTGFEKELRGLSESLFGGEGDPAESLTGPERSFLNDCVRAGTYGNVQGAVRWRMKEMNMSVEDFSPAGKLRYLWKRLFPDREWIRKRAPFVADHVVLIPFYLVYRFFRELILRRKGVINEVKGLIRFKEKKKNDYTDR